MYENLRINDADIDTDFSYENYRRGLRAIKKRHRPLSFRDVYEMGSQIDTIDRYVIMRHDIEVSVAAALNLAQIDAEEGISSTFFFLLTGDYNVLGRHDGALVRRIIELGHDIGLHYDLALLADSGNDIPVVLEAQAKLLGETFGVRVHAASCHMPMRFGSIVPVPGVINPYDAPYFSDIKYLSDSNQAWREGSIIRNLEKHDRIQLLMHENCWTQNGLRFEHVLLLEAAEKANRITQENHALALQMNDGLRRRAEKDREFQEVLRARGRQ